MIELQTEYCVASVVEEASSKYRHDDDNSNNNNNNNNNRTSDRDVEYTVEIPLTLFNDNDEDDDEYILDDDSEEICLSSGLPVLEEVDESCLTPSSNCEDGDEIHHQRIISDETMSNSVFPSLPQPIMNTGNSDSDSSPKEFQLPILQQEDEESLVSSSKSFSESLQQHVYPDHDDSSKKTTDRGPGTD